MSMGTGSFMIRGKRNFISPQKLELGYTVMFCLNEESLSRHIGERAPREDPEELAKLEKEKLAAIIEEQEANFDDGVSVSDATTFFN